MQQRCYVNEETKKLLIDIAKKNDIEVINEKGDYLNYTNNTIQFYNSREFSTYLENGWKDTIINVDEMIKELSKSAIKVPQPKWKVAGPEIKVEETKQGQYFLWEDKIHRTIFFQGRRKIIEISNDITTYVMFDEMVIPLTLE